MAIAFVGADFASAGLGSSSVTKSIDPTGANLLVIGVLTGSGNAPTATFNAVSMTDVGTNTAASGYGLWMFYLNSPTAGAHNLVVTLGSGTNLIDVPIAWYSGDGGAGPENAITSATNNGATLAASHSTVAANAWEIAVFGGSTGSNPTVTSGNPANSRASGNDGTSFGCGGLFDSGVVASPGSFTFSIDNSGFNNMLIASFAPTGGGGATYPSAIINNPVRG